MNFIDQLKALGGKVPACDILQTEEATKNALVMPFIHILGYDIFDSTGVKSPNSSPTWESRRTARSSCSSSARAAAASTFA